MYIKYGSYQHAANEATISISREAIYGDNGVVRAQRIRWSIAGRYQADTLGGLIAGLTALELAYVEVQSPDDRS